MILLYKVVSGILKSYLSHENIKQKIACCAKII